MNRAKYTVERICRLFRVSRSAYYEWLKAKKVVKIETTNIEFEIRRIFEWSKGTYGSPRVCIELSKIGVITSVSTVARIMRKLKLQARPRRKYVHTTDSEHGYSIFENILNRGFISDQVNQMWVSDITYIPTKEGWTYLTVVIDLADRMVVGWNLSKDMSARNTSIASINIALQRRQPKSSLLFHSDRGVQYCCAEFRYLLKTKGNVRQSMSRKGNCWDNAPAESFFKTLKVEWTRKFDYADKNEAQKSIFDYIERWYNPKRIHSANGYLSPLQKFYLLNQTAA